MRITSDSIGNLFVKLFMCLIGLLIAIPTAYKIYDHVSFQRQSTAAEGTITDAGCSVYFGCKPFIEYTDTKKQVHEFRSKTNFYFFASPKKGDKIQVLFLNSDHGKAIISSTFYNIIQPLCFFLAGASIITVLIIRSIKPKILNHLQSTS